MLENPKISMQTIIENRTKYNPIFIYEQKDYDREMVLRKLETIIKKKDPDASVGYFTAEDIINALWDRERNKKSKDVMVEFGTECLAYDYVLIDEMEHIKNTEKTQREFFHLVDRLVGCGKHVFVNSILGPDRLSIFYQLIMGRLPYTLVLGTGQIKDIPRKGMRGEAGC